MFLTKKTAKLGLALCFVTPFTFAQESATEEVLVMDTIDFVGERIESETYLETKNSASNRLGLSAMDVPASSQSIDKEAIESKADYSSLSAVTRATGFASSASPGNGGTSVSVRGFNGHSSVAQTSNGNRMYVGAGTSTFPADTGTLEKIEVLRGPGSVINGVGAIGATVNYVSKQAKFDEVEHEVKIVGGSNNLNRVTYGSGGQLNDKTAYRFDAIHHKTDGYVDRADEKRRVIAGALKFVPQDNVDLTLNLNYDNIDAAPYWGTPLINGKIDKDIRKENYNAKDGLINYKNFWPQLNAEVKINDKVTFNNNLHYLNTRRHWRNIESYAYNQANNQVDRSFYLEILHKQKQVGNRSDFLIESDVFGKENKLNIGAEITKIDFEHTNNSPYSGTSSVALNNPDVGNWSDGALSQTTKDYVTETTQHAFFVDNHLKINPKLSIVAGLRYDNIDYEREDFARSNGQTAGEIDTKLSGTSGRFGAVYQPNENTSLYAQFSRAKDSIQSILTTTNPELKLSTGEQVEVGIKQQLLDDKFQYTLSVFDITKEDLQSQDPITKITRQIGEQSSRGVELEVDAALTEQIALSANVSVLKAKYDEFISRGSDYTGNQPRNVPEKTANLWVNYQPTDKWNYGAGVRHVGKRYANDSNTRELPSYTVFDANIQWQPTDKIQVNAVAKNISDEVDYVLAPYGDQWILADGRSYELGVDYKF